MGSTWGKNIKLSLFGESHGVGIGITIDGLPAGVELDLDAIKLEMQRRATGKNELTTARKEADTFEILSGYFNGYTTGAPLSILIRNRDQQSRDYSKIKDIARPAHVELAFCILTPQSKARGAEKAIDGMRNAGVFWTGIEDDLIPYLNVVRFKNTKAKNLVILREFMKDEEGRIITKTLVDKMGDVFEKRIWLVKNIKGIGYKEASHFLRNIGFGDEIAILDRHILKNIMRLEVIDEIPKTITPKKYLEIEKKIEKYCREIEIPMDHFDLLLWYLEAGEVFK